MEYFEEVIKNVLKFLKRCKKKQKILGKNKCYEKGIGRFEKLWEFQK